MKSGDTPRFLALDGLRAYAALAVIVYHAILSFDQGLIHRVLPKTFWQIEAGDLWAKAWLSIFNGAAAVELFFLLSGCVLMRSLAAAQGDWFSIAASFVVKRALRIYPGLIPCVVVTALVSAPALSPPLSWPDVAGNIALWNAKIVGPSWTLQIEMLAIPVMLAVGALSRKFGTFAIVAALLVALVARKNPELFVAPLLGQYGYLFVLGALVPSALGTIAASWTKQIGWLPTLLAFIFLRQFAAGMDLETAALGFMLLAQLYHDKKAATASVFTSRVPQFLGKVSFGIYLWNVPFLYMLYLVPTGLLPSDAASAGLIVAAVITPVTIALATLSYHFIEAPGIALGKKLVDFDFKGRRAADPFGDDIPRSERQSSTI